MKGRGLSLSIVALLLFSINATAELIIYDGLFGNQKSTKSAAKDSHKKACKTWQENIEQSELSNSVIFKNCGFAKFDRHYKQEKRRTPDQCVKWYGLRCIEVLKGWSYYVDVLDKVQAYSRVSLRVDPNNPVTQYEEELEAESLKEYVELCKEFKKNAADQLGDRLFFASCEGKGLSELRRSSDGRWRSTGTLYVYED